MDQARLEGLCVNVTMILTLNTNDVYLILWYGQTEERATKNAEHMFC